MDPHQLDLALVLRSTNPQTAKCEFDSYAAGKVPPQSMDSGFAMSQIGG